MSVNEKMTAIADNIRSKTGGTEALELDDMASGVNDVYDAGKQAEYDVFWDAFQNKGAGYYGAYTFWGEFWNNKNFFPKYDIVIIGGVSATFGTCAVTNLRERINGRGLKIRLGTGATSLNQCFSNAKTTELPVFDTSPAKDFSYYCSGASNLVTVTDLNLTNATNTTSIFASAKKLANITFVGTIPISISFSSSPLTVESMKNVISHLKNYKGTDKEFTYKVTFSSACITALDAEGNTSPNGNTWREYATDLGWNI